MRPIHLAHLDTPRPVLVLTREPALREGDGSHRSADRIAQEALTNTLKHSGAASASVRLAYGRSSSLVVEVVDDGTQTPPDGGTGHGLVGIGERVSVFRRDGDGRPSLSRLAPGMPRSAARRQRPDEPAFRHERIDGALLHGGQRGHCHGTSPRIATVGLFRTWSRKPLRSATSSGVMIVGLISRPTWSPTR
jgi:hypothetical protein